MNRLCSTEEDEADSSGIFSETLQAQESHPTMAAEVQVDSAILSTNSRLKNVKAGNRSLPTQERGLLLLLKTSSYQIVFGTSHNSTTPTIFLFSISIPSKIFLPPPGHLSYSTFGTFSYLTVISLLPWFAA
ncbi:hypothetical protein DUI87_30741 [Hirundo rustica rustica]|uniref:Uncharacterized protein n=1 Tax=Hirundo rustica rustica TaxID=333673 RepID=A0A3M0IVL2_HIRRU|nr:hypothetical protein DUI87_30741 [Hirundo rustica rustica]